MTTDRLHVHIGLTVVCVCFVVALSTLPWYVRLSLPLVLVCAWYVFLDRRISR